MGALDTQFTPDEQRTLMTLWSIARSPLIMGGDLRHLDAATLALLTNPAVIAVNQASSHNQPHFIKDGMRCWSARAAGSTDRYVALFNLGKDVRETSVALAALGIAGSQRVLNLWSGAVHEARAVSAILPAHGAGLFRVSPAL